MVLRTTRLAALGTLLATLAVAPPAEAAMTWAPTGSLATPRADHTATLLPDGRVLVAGGYGIYASNSPSAPQAAAELYDPATGVWSPAAPMASARGGHTATLLTGPGCASACGKVLVAGGAAGAGAELYDPAPGAWSPAGSLATPRAFHTASLLQGPACSGGAPPAWCGKVLVAGGAPTNAPFLVALPSAELYDPGTNSWVSTGPLAVARTEHTATMLSDGSVLAVAGRAANAAAERSAERYDPAAGTWAGAGELAVGRIRPTASPLPNGDVLVTGGLDLDANPRRSAEVYDASAPGGSWLHGNPMNHARGRATADLMPDGTLFVVAGGGQSLDLASTEIYRPATGTWTAGAQMAVARQRHTATLLTGPGCASRCGRLLVAGGLRQNSTTLSSAELLGPAPVVQAAQAANPRTVTDLLARALSSRRIELTFSAPGAGNAPPAYELPVRRFVVKQSRSPISAANFDRARSLCGGACSFAVSRPRDRVRLTVEDLVPNRAFYYALKPLDAAGRPGAISNVARARTFRDRTRPGKPGRLSARALRRARIRLRWRAPASDRRSGPPVRRYVVKQSTRPITSARRFRRARSLCKSSCRFAPRRRGSRLSLTVRRLCPGRRYYYAIRAKDEGGNLSRIARFRSVRAKGRRGVTCL